jgi:hypothetical protein
MAWKYHSRNSRLKERIGGASNNNFKGRNENRKIATEQAGDLMNELS